MNTKSCIATKVPGIVKCFNPVTGHGVISSLDENEDVSVHQRAIVNGKPVREGEMVELDILVGSKGLEAANVTVVELGDEGESDATKKRKNLISVFANLWRAASFRKWMLDENSISLHTKELQYQNLNRRELDGTENVIKFQIIDKDMSPESGGYGSLNDPIPFVSLSNVEKDVGRMLDVDEIVVPEEVKSISVVFNYPLKQSFVFELESPTGKGFTRGELATVIAYKYQEIYKEERQTSTVPEESLADRMERLGAGGGCRLINRAQTDGKYGIWGHYLQDLDLNQVIYSETQDCYYLSVDS